MQHLNIPAELRAREQWCACGPDKVPVNPRTRKFAMVDDPSTWGTFEEALTLGLKHVGYVLSKDDPYTIIDLDNKPEHPASPEELERHQAIIDNFDSYTERSTSGRGTHIIVRGKVPKGVRRGNTEVYSDARFMICTGDVVKPLPVVDRQDMLLNMYSQMQPTNFVDLSEDGDEEYTDREIHERALDAENGDKYELLTRNDQDWRDVYPSQSEADLALIAMLTFYGKNNDQVKRLFWSGPLGQREKAHRPDYLNRAIKLSRTRQAEREPPPVDFKLAAEIANTIRAKPAETAIDADNVYTLPPGLIGETAKYILSTSLQPSIEIAIAAALGLFAGVAARTYNTTTKSGLNLYLAVVARTGYGKEHMKRSIERLVGKLRLTVPSINDVIGPGHFASGQAIVKTLNENPCFLSILGEFGDTLHAWLDSRSNSSEKLCMKILLDCYGKSGAEDALRPHVYSDKEKNTQIIQSPNISILGESNPEEFYGSLELSHVTRGFVPRLVIIEPEGSPPDFNDSFDIEPSDTLLQGLADLMTTVTMARHNNNHFTVPHTPDAAKLLLKFRDDCHTRVLADDTLGDIWNRAHLNALRIATLISVGCNHQDPCVTLEHAQWAIRLVEHCAGKLYSRYERGAVGASQKDEPLTVAIKWWLKATPKQRLSYKATKATSTTDCMPLGYFRNKLKRWAAYRDDRRGVDIAIKAQLDTYCELGFLRKLSREECSKLGSSLGMIYAVGPEFEG